MMCCGCALEAQVLRKLKKPKQQKISKYAWAKYLERQEAVNNNGKTKKYPGET